MLPSRETVTGTAPGFEFELVGCMRSDLAQLVHDTPFRSYACGFAYGNPAGMRRDDLASVLVA